MAALARAKLACRTGGLARMAAPGVLSVAGLTGCSTTQQRMMSHSVCMGASVLSASGLQCAVDARYPALTMAERNRSAGGGVHCTDHPGLG